LLKDLLSLPGLYSDCGRGAGPKTVRVIRKAPRNGTDPMPPAAAEIRTGILAGLASWAALVADGRRVTPPARDVPALSRFLARHADWLSRHPAGGDLADEVGALARTARAVAHPGDVRRVRIGRCPHGDCGGDVVALMRPAGAGPPSEIVCTVSPDHAWPATSWTRLARQLRPRQTQGERS
jgi:hypothetical protein